jgi:signal transduction histidine kinase
LNDDARHYLTRVQDGARHMGLLVDDLLNLSQIGRQGLLLQACSLGTIVGEIVATLGPELAERDVRVELDHLPTLSCDPGLAKIVFTNLLSNALKYTRDKSPAAIEVSSLIRDGQRVLYVRDNGVGFDLKYADKLFGVFQRLHKEFEGTGIGLATVQRIIHKHGGEIWADAAPNKGATFYFTFGPPPHARSQID